MTDLNPLRWTNVIVNDREIHCIPLNDNLRHLCETDKCWCQPREAPDGLMYLHQSADGRELYAQGILKHH